MIVVPPPPPPSSSAGPAAVSATLPISDAPALKGAPLGAILQGAVVSNAPGALVVQTAQGQISLPVTLAGLKVGQQVTLTLQPGPNGGQVLIQADRPPPPGSTTVADLLPNLQGAAQPVRAGAIVQAVVIRAPVQGQGEAPTSPTGLPISTGAAAPAGSTTAPASAPTSVPTGAPAAAIPTAQPGVPTPASATSAPAGQNPPLAAAPPPASSQQVPTQASPVPGQPSAVQPTATAQPAVQPQIPTPQAAANPIPTAEPAPVLSPTAGTSTPTATATPAPAGTPATTPATIIPADAQTVPPPPARAGSEPTPALLRGASNGDRVALRVISVLPAGVSPSAPDGVAPATTAALPTFATAATNGAAPAASTASAATLAPGNFVAVVVGASANGSAIVRAGAGLLTLEGVSAPVNSAVVLASATPRGQTPVPPARLDNAALAASLPGVAELITAANATGGPAQAALQAILPRLGPQMAAGMVYFMRALRSGDIGDWLGKDARVAIERSGRASTMKKASAEIERLAAANEASGEWSVYPVPLGVGGQRVEPIRLYVRQAEDEGESTGGKGGKPQPTRFLIDVRLSRLGRIQLDGLARMPKLDLVVRSESPLASGLQQPLKRLFADVTSARGIQGDMSFQVAPPIDPTVAVAAKARPGIMV